jgi:hypothetical protein
MIGLPDLLRAFRCLRISLQLKRSPLPARCCNADATPAFLMTMTPNVNDEMGLTLSH